MNSRVLVITAGLSLVVLAWVGLFAAGVPTVYCPMPTLTLVPGLLLSSWRVQKAVVLIPAILFFLWTPGLIWPDRSSRPRRTIVLVALLSVVAAVDFRLGWKNGVQFQGLRYTAAVGGINAIWIALTWWAMLRAWRRPSFRTSLLSHWILLAWLAWYAFPYLGELP